MKLSAYEGKKARIEDIDGQTFYGVVTDYIFPEDNVPEGESIVLRTLQNVHIEFRKEEIKNIELIK